MPRAAERVIQNTAKGVQALPRDPQQNVKLKDTDISFRDFCILRFGAWLVIS